MSTQAYGFAMAEGHMDSLSKGAALFTYKKVAYFDPAEDCCGAENTRSPKEHGRP